MESTYTSYGCRTCKKEFVLLSEDVKTHESQGKYLACPYCNSKRISKQNINDSLKECMSAHSYRRNHGAIAQIR